MGDEHVDEEAQRAAARARQRAAEAEEEALLAAEEKWTSPADGMVFMVQREAADFCAARVDLLQRARAGDEEAVQVGLGTRTGPIGLLSLTVHPCSSPYGDRSLARRNTAGFPVAKRRDRKPYESSRSPMR